MALQTSTNSDLHRDFHSTLHS